jgi:predicted phosphate transport protein (TIGR00153 family)
LEKRSYKWFEKRRRTKALDLAQEQIVKALDTVTMLSQAVQSLAEGKKEEATRYIQNLFKTEEEVDRLRKEVFKELSKGAALFADYREDILHLVKRLDTLADHVKDAARCVEMLKNDEQPHELTQNTVHMTSALVECASALRASIEKISDAPEEAIAGSNKVEEIEHRIDENYLNTKALFVKYGEKMNPGTIVIFDDLIEFIEQAADMCADTADYIVILSSRERSESTVS